MVMPVVPGGAYFVVRDMGADYTPEEDYAATISYAQAAAMVAGSGTVDVIDVAIPEVFPDESEPPITFSGAHPRAWNIQGADWILAVNMEYDGGFWDDHEPGDWRRSSCFLVSLHGAASGLFVPTTDYGVVAPFRVMPYVSSDGGQALNVKVDQATSSLAAALTHVRIWRIDGPAGPVPEDFWSRFIGTKEVP